MNALIFQRCYARTSIGATASNDPLLSIKRTSPPSMICLEPPVQPDFCPFHGLTAYTWCSQAVHLLPPQIVRAIS